VVAAGIASGKKQYSAGVPQGGIWSPLLWNFFIQDMPSRCLLTLLFKYADDCTLLKVFNPSERMGAVYDLNADLKRVARWGKRWKTTFEPTKTHAMFVSKTRDNGIYPAIDLLEFGGVKIGYDDVLRIVGVIYDRKLTWGPMVNEMASRGRRALGYLNRLGKLMDSGNKATIYKYFVRSKMEYGNASYSGAAPSHLEKLDAVQDRATKLTGASFQSLSGRRDAACFGLLCKLLDQKCAEPLLDMCPGFGLDTSELCMHPHNTRSQLKRNEDMGLARITNMKNTFRKESLRAFERSFVCKTFDIFDMIPQELKIKGMKESWSLVMKEGQRHLSLM
jgi:hypothetical protein